MHHAGCVLQWFHTAEPLGERRYENWNTHTHSLPPNTRPVYILSMNDNRPVYIHYYYHYYYYYLHILKMSFSTTIQNPGSCCFGFNGPLRQYFSLYRAISQREGERRERIDESKNVQTTPIRTYCKRSRPLPYCNPNCRTPPHWKFTQHHRTTRPPLNPGSGKRDTVGIIFGIILLKCML